MRAITIPRPGDADVLELREVPIPRPGRSDVLVEVHHAGVNRADIGLREGRSPDPSGRALPIPGLEYAGVVHEVGEDVRSFRVGDAVMGIESGGCYAEYVVSNERMVMPTPPGMSLSDAAGIPECFLTAWDALVVQGAMTSGRWALIHAGGSGVGTAAIQLMKQLGGFVATTSSADKVERCRLLGADLALRRSPDDWCSPLLEHVPNGAHTILDVVGGDEIARNFDVLREQGVIVQVGLMAGRSVDFDVGALVARRATWIGTTLKNRPLEQKATLTQRFITEVLPLFSDGRLKPIIDTQFRIEEASDAHRYMESNANFGKIILSVRG